VRPLRPVRRHLPVARSPDGCWHACIVCISRRHLDHGDGRSLWLRVGPVRRV